MSLSTCNNNNIRVYNTLTEYYNYQQHLKSTSNIPLVDPIVNPIVNPTVESHIDPLVKPLDSLRNTIDLNQEIKQIKSLDDLIKIATIPPIYFKPFNGIDLLRLRHIVEPMKKLNELVGMNSLKQTIIYQILYYCQNLHKFNQNVGQLELMHTAIMGNSGCGKTTVASLIAKIYIKLGLVSEDKFIVASRKDLVGEFLGQTAPKTTKVLQSALNGILFIDEAYALGGQTSNGKHDQFSKECLDTINQFLTEYKHSIIVIIAGYKDSLKDTFFSSNQGLHRRFPWVYEIEDYTPQQLQQILINKITKYDHGWSLSDDLTPSYLITLLKNNQHLFTCSGGDIETYITKCKLSHSKNTFGLPIESKRRLTKADMIDGMELHRLSKPNGSSSISPDLIHMYM